MDEKKDLLSITGMFIQDHSPQNMYYFGGLMLLDQTESLEETFKGHLIDDYGHSTIQGIISPHKLEFGKIYQGHKNLIKYIFEKSDVGIWQGTYKSLNERIGEGRALCKTNLDWGNINIALREYGNPETWARNMIDRMVQDGYLKVEKDENGKEVIGGNRNP